EALREFQTAYDLSPNWRILYNIGQTSRATRDYAGSLRAFERYLSEGGKEVPKARRAEVEKEVASLNGLVARIDVTAPEGSTVQLEGAVIGKTPLEQPLVVNPGQRKIQIEHDGQSETREIGARAGSTQKLEVGQPAPAPPTPSATAPPA